MAPRKQPTRRCIPVGCLPLILSTSKIPPELWNEPDFKKWSRLVVESPSGEPHPPDHGLSRIAPLRHDLQRLVLSSFDKKLNKNLDKSMVQLLQNRWIEMAIIKCIDDPGQCVLRVYLLPDDIDRIEVDRDEQKLRKARLQLLDRLDCSRSTWEGQASKGPAQPPASDGAEDEDDGQSLLEMFNTIPEPSPEPDEIPDDYAKDAAYELFSDDIRGLSTELRPYQRSSATMMLERESRPYQVLDPRLVKVSDQYGRPWYYDRVNGFGLLEPRQYDGVEGGILAEQMGAGKTLICLALILATKHQTSQAPGIYRGTQDPRPRIGSLADMAAAAITMNAVPWKPWFDAGGHYEYDYQNCRQCCRRNPGYYYMNQMENRRSTRQPQAQPQRRKVYLSYATLVIVPGNLVQQWLAEIDKHTEPGSLRKIVMTHKAKLPPIEELIDTEIILFSHSAFQNLQLSGEDNALTNVHFKRCIVDEGHTIGKSKDTYKSNLLRCLDSLQLSARWVVSGTPAKGLIGVSQDFQTQSNLEFSDQQEMEDLKAIGNMTTFYLRARPWANTIADYPDTEAKWSTYVLQPRHSKSSSGRKDCLRATLDSLMIRHRQATLDRSLPTTVERVVHLEGSYQDQLCLNLFSMVIIFNAVLSQRTDQDYFFHKRNRTYLGQLVHNLRQSSFFGGSFFAPEDITGAVETAEKALEEGKLPLSKEDEALIRGAIAFGKSAARNMIKECSKSFGEVPFYVEHFPGSPEKAKPWSLDARAADPVLTNARLVVAMQTCLKHVVGAPHSLQQLLDNGRFEQEGSEARTKAYNVASRAATTPRKQAGSVTASPAATPTNAPNSMAQKVVDEAGRERKHIKHDSHGGCSSRTNGASAAAVTPAGDIAEPLAKTRIISTASAKMSYLLDEITAHCQDEKILVFYEAHNVAWDLAFMLEILGIEHRIYSVTLSVDTRSEYARIFNKEESIRVMLMDLTVGAFGIDLLASRVYFINPVLDPQIEAQAIGRARRTSQERSITVVTLVLRGSLEELILRRRKEMTAAEQRKCKTILDDTPIREWISNARIRPFSQGDEQDGLSQMAPLNNPQYLFGRRAERRTYGLQEDEPTFLAVPKSSSTDSMEAADALVGLQLSNDMHSRKRPFEESPAAAAAANLDKLTPTRLQNGGDIEGGGTDSGRPARRVRFAGGDDW